MDQGKRNIIIGIVFFIIMFGSIIYRVIFDSDYDPKGDNILKNTKLGVSIEIINKNSINFNSNAINNFTDMKDFSQIINNSQTFGRSNPFLP